MSALGQLLSGEPHGPFRNLILQYLFGLAPIKEIDLHLSVGEALALIGATVPPAASASASPASTLPSLPPVVPPRKAGPWRLSAALLRLRCECRRDQQARDPQRLAR